MIYDITPCPAPRMTKADAWKKRPCVLRYFAFKDEIESKKVTYNCGQAITFVIPFPKSYSKNKREGLNGKPHLLTPDADNLLKALLDAIFSQSSGKNDSHVWHIGEIKKIWGHTGKIIIN